MCVGMGVCVCVCMSVCVYVCVWARHSGVVVRALDSQPKGWRFESRSDYW